MIIKDRVWATFCNMKFKGFLLSILVSKYQKLDRFINIFLAIASSGSIAAWALWQSNPMVWSSIIAASQVITTIKPYFPYSKIIKELNSRCYKIELLNIEFERFWTNIQANKLSNDAITQSYYDHNRAYAEIFNFPDDLLFETSKSIENKANLKMRNYLKSHHGIEILIETSKN